MGKPVVVNKVNKVNEKVVKVNVGQVKPQITFIKRLVSKHLVSNKLAAPTNTPTKPESIKLNEGQSKTVQSIIKKGLVEVATKYDFTTKPQMTYIQNHFNTHSSKYLK